MAGLKLLSGQLTETIQLVLFDPQYRAIIHKQSYGSKDKRQNERTGLKQISALGPRANAKALAIGGEAAGFLGGVEAELV